MINVSQTDDTLYGLLTKALIRTLQTWLMSSGSPPPNPHNPSLPCCHPNTTAQFRPSCRERKKNPLLGRERERGRSEKKVMACPFIRVDLCRCIDGHISTKPCIFTARPKNHTDTPTFKYRKTRPRRDDESHKKEVMSQRASRERTTPAAGICSAYTDQVGS